MWDDRHALPDMNCNAVVKVKNYIHVPLAIYGYILKLKLSYLVLLISLLLDCTSGTLINISGIGYFII